MNYLQANIMDIEIGNFVIPHPFLLPIGVVAFLLVLFIYDTERDKETRGCTVCFLYLLGFMVAIFLVFKYFCMPIVLHMGKQYGGFAAFITFALFLFFMVLLPENVSHLINKVKASFHKKK